MSINQKERRKKQVEEKNDKWGEGKLEATHVYAVPVTRSTRTRSSKKTKRRKERETSTTVYVTQKKHKKKSNTPVSIRFKSQ